MSRKRTMCVAQVGYDADHIEDHVEKLKVVIDEHHDADLLVFPELILQGHPDVDRPEGFLYRRARARYGLVSAELYRHARDRDARVIVGEIKRRVERLYNVASYVDRHRLQHYTKAHVHWSENFVPGTKLRCFDTARVGKVGINICFDAAFSEVWRVLALRGPCVIVNISAVPAHFPVAYMHRRMQGAALNNQVYVVYANRPGPEFGGGSAVFDPRGEFVVSTGRDEDVLEVEIDLAQVDRWRDEEEIFPNRKPELYRQIGHSGTPSRSRRELEEVAS